MSELSGVLTDLGAQLIEEAYQAGQVITLTEMGLGDGGGSDVNVSPDVTALVGEFHRQALDSGVAEDAALGGAINYVPENEDRGKWVRELGMYDDAGNLIVYGATPLAQIPINPNLGVQFIISAAVPIEYVDSVVVVVNPEGSATREDLEEHERSRRHPAAEEGQQGMIPLATQEMVAEGDDHASALTPKTAAVHYFPLASYKPRTDSLNTQERAVEIIKDKDMNTCKAGEFGLYERASCPNSPPGTSQFYYCETKATSHSFNLTQFASTYALNDSQMAWRNISATATPTGSPWCMVYDSHYKPTPDEIGAANASHTHDWGQVGAPERVAGGYGEVFPAGDHGPLLTQSGFFSNNGGLGSYGEPFPGQWAYLFHNSHPNAAGFCGTLAMNFNGTQLRYSVIDGGAGIGWKTIFTQDEPPQIGNIPGLQAALDSKAGLPHAHSAAEGNWDIVAGGWGQIGTQIYAALIYDVGQPGLSGVIAGDYLRPSGGGEWSYDASIPLPGTWKQLGSLLNMNNDDKWDDRSSLWIRIA